VKKKVKVVGPVKVKVNVRVQVLRGLEALKVEVVGPVKVKVNVRVHVLRLQWQLSAQRRRTLP
jgi:hypothetical protein